PQAYVLLQVMIRSHRQNILLRAKERERATRAVGALLALVMQTVPAWPEEMANTVDVEQQGVS
ncbi:hypothetical protein BaRGS_00028736, partial [Batillaria attramentaria]